MVNDTNATKKLQVRGKKECKGSVDPVRPNFNYHHQLTAMEIAMSVSVTVSMGEDIKGVFSVIFFVILDSNEASWAGKSM